MIKDGSYIFVARQNIIDAKYKDLKKGLLKSLGKINALKEDAR